jgi:S-adenosylmethionine hydrolase
MPRGTLYLCVVDPGVGGERAGLLVSSEGDWFLGPDNGLLSRIVARRPGAKVHRIGWRPEAMSASFHGRDWFAPAAARLCLGEPLELAQVGGQALVGMDWRDELPAVVYVDHFGNLICGVRAAALPDGSRTKVKAGGRVLERARTFCEVVEGQPFWYEDSLGLLEIAVNQGRADRLIGLGPGDPIELLTDGQAEVAGV